VKAPGGRALLLVVLSILLGACGGGDPVPGPPPVPAQYRALYDELEDALSTYEARVNAEWDGTNRTVRLATALVPANSHAGPQLLDPSYQAVVHRYLDALVAVGADAVVVPINYPLLTASCVDQAPEYLAFFADLAAEVRSRGLELLVEHNVLIPGFSAVDVATCYVGLTAQEFGFQRYAEVLAIVEQVQPEYLSLVTEPETTGTAIGLFLSPATWRTYVEGVVDQLEIDVPGHATRLGAGSGTWEAVDYVAGFAQVSALDYVDLHVYPPASPAESFLDRLLDWPDLVRAIDPGKGFVMSEGWLYKAAAAEIGGNPIDPDQLARDVWSFWEPLDELFLDAMARTAHHEGYELIAPFWSRYFFAYLEHGDPAFAGLDAMELMGQANLAAYGAIVAGETTGTGRTFRTLSTTALSK
jgi:hypothetical protein